MPEPKRVTLTKAERRLATQGQRSMLLAEAHALSALRDVSAASVDRIIRAADAAPTKDAARRVVLTQMRPTGERLRQDIADAVQAARGDARARAHAQLGVELEAATKGLRRPAVAVPRAEAHEDAPRADAVADSYAAAVRTSAIAATVAWSRGEDDVSLGATLRRAHEAQDYRLRRIAATEVASAYGAEHNDASDSLVRRVAQLAPFLIKVWDAKVDAATCPFCDDMDGRWAVLGTKFKHSALPGHAHAFCRCTSVLLPVWAAKRAMKTIAKAIAA